MNTRQILSCGSGYTRNCITDAYIKTVGARSLRAHLESVKTSVQGRGIYLYVKRKKMRCYITLTRAYVLIRVYSSALDFTLNTLNFILASYKGSSKKWQIEKKADYMKHLHSFRDLITKATA